MRLCHRCADETSKSAAHEHPTLRRQAGLAPSNLLYEKSLASLKPAPSSLTPRVPLRRQTPPTVLGLEDPTTRIMPLRSSSPTPSPVPSTFSSSPHCCSPPTDQPPPWSTFSDERLLPRRPKLGSPPARPALALDSNHPRRRPVATPILPMFLIWARPDSTQMNSGFSTFHVGLFDSNSNF